MGINSDGQHSIDATSSSWQPSRELHHGRYASMRAGRLRSTTPRSGRSSSSCGSLSLFPTRQSLINFKGKARARLDPVLSLKRQSYACPLRSIGSRPSEQNRNGE